MWSIVCLIRRKYLLWWLRILLSPKKYWTRICTLSMSSLSLTWYILWSISWCYLIMVISMCNTSSTGKDSNLLWMNAITCKFHLLMLSLMKYMPTLIILIRNSSTPMMMKRLRSSVLTRRNLKSNWWGGLSFCLKSELWINIRKDLIGILPKKSNLKKSEIKLVIWSLSHHIIIFAVAIAKV